MIMKLKSFFAYILIFITLSCSDFLDHPLTDAVSDDNIGEIIQRNPEKLEEFLASAFRAYGGIALYGRELVLGISTMAHEMDIDWLGEESRNEFVKNQLTSVNTYVSKYYTQFYAILSSLNLVIDLIDHIDLDALSESDQTMVKNFKGESLYLRACVHFDLLRLFGEKGPYFGGDYPNNKDAMGIVLADGLVNANNAYSARATVEECYDSILQDLNDAEDLIGNNQIPVNNTPAKPGYSDTDYTKNTGWAQKPAVIVLRGKVYLYMNMQAEAKTEFDKIIVDSRFKLDKLVNLNDYLQHTDNNAESIFALQYYYTSSGTAYDNAPSHQIPRIFGNTPGGWKNYYVDLRTAGRFDADPRLYETSLYDKTYSTWSTLTSKPVFTEISNMGPTTRYYIRKFTDFYNTTSPRDPTKNIELIRLGDIYLMYAEVLLKQGDVSNATEFVNKLRRRAWNETNYDSPGTKGEDLASIDLATLQHERYKEMFFENTRWFDLCRWGTLQQEVSLYPTTGAGDSHYDDNDYYLPMPEKEIKSNPLLKQSKGY
jgi:tetratricopeptide (TPR) repeat protein